jgi:hypothetical protein
MLKPVCRVWFVTYPVWGFSVLFSRLWGKCQDINRKDGARSAPFLICELCYYIYCFCRVCCSMYCLFVNVYCTTTIGIYPITVKYIISKHTRVHLLWLWEFWIGISAWWFCWTPQFCMWMITEGLATSKVCVWKLFTEYFEKILPAYAWRQPN